MDPSSLFREGSFSSMNNASFHNSFSDLWSFSINGGAVLGESSVLDVKRSEFERNLSGFGVVIGLRNRNGSADESTVTDQSGRSGGRSGKKRRDAEDEFSKPVSTSNCNDMNNGETKRRKVSEFREENGGKTEVEASFGTGNKTGEQNSQPSEPPKQDYIHVRARRGQATDSHSLAERARREKISERMKILQDLVPGCNKVIGKASVLDEIINYIQALQSQVEFLSMKLEAVNSRPNLNIEGFPAKETFDTATMAFGSQPRKDYSQGSQPEWLHMQVQSGLETES